MTRAAQHRTPVPRTLHVCSLAFLLTVGLFCALLVLSVPMMFVRDPTRVPDHLSVWLWYAGTGLYPVLHWIGVYRRSIIASLLVVPFHLTFAWILVKTAQLAIMEDAAIVEGAAFLLIAGSAVFVSGLLLWWAWRLRAVRTGRAAPPPIVPPAKQREKPEYVPIGTRGWLIERSDVAREMRQMNETIRRRARWFLPLWVIVRWPLYVLTWGGMICASIVVPGFAVTFAAMIGGGPDGAVFWMLIALIFAALLAMFVLMAWVALGKMRKTIIDVDMLTAIPFTALGMAAVVLAVMTLRHPEWGWEAERERIEAVEPQREP